MSDLLTRRQARCEDAATGWPPNTRFNGIAMQAAILLAAALLIRVWQFGNPVIHVDEQFYLLVGDRMLQGDLPYVDIWDRKPVGLFIIYAAIRLLGGSGIIEYQLVATLFAAGTALLIARIGLRIGSGFGGVSAGIAYLCWLMIFGGDGGQSPVFYNAFVAGAALLTLDAVTDRQISLRKLARTGAIVMLLAGIAMQVKYTALFEGVFFGLALMWKAWSTTRKPSAVVALGALWVGIALAPTALAWGYYASRGYSEIFFFSNFMSIFNRPPSPSRDLISRLGEMFMFSAPLWLCAIFSIRGKFDAGAVRPAVGAKMFVMCWLGAATLGLLIFGSYYDHYFLPVLVPLTAMIVPLVGAPGSGLSLFQINRRTVTTPFIAVLAVLSLVAAKIVIYDNVKGRGDGAAIDRIAAVVQPRLTNCMFVFDVEAILYLKTNACFNSRYVFSPHLSSFWEDNAAGVNTQAEVRRILDSKPSIIVTSKDIEHQPNLATWLMVQGELARKYRLIHSEKIGYGTRLVFERLPAV